MRSAFRGDPGPRRWFDSRGVSVCLTDSCLAGLGKSVEQKERTPTSEPGFWVARSEHLGSTQTPPTCVDFWESVLSSQHAVLQTKPVPRQARDLRAFPDVPCAAPGDKMAARGRRAEPPGREAPGPAGDGGSRWAESGPGTSPESGDDEVSGSSPVSSGVNLFANDGSFLELFKRKMEEEQRQRQEEPPPGPQRPDPSASAAAGPGNPKRKGGPGPTLSFVRSRGGGGGRRGPCWQGESGPGRGVMVQGSPPSGRPDGPGRLLRMLNLDSGREVFLGVSGNTQILLAGPGNREIVLEAALWG